MAAPIAALVGVALANHHARRIQSADHAFALKTQALGEARAALARLNEATEAMQAIIGGAIVTNGEVTAPEERAELSRASAAAEIYIREDVWDLFIHPYLEGIARVVNSLSPYATPEMVALITMLEPEDDRDLSKRRRVFVAGLRQSLALLSKP